MAALRQGVVAEGCFTNADEVREDFDPMGKNRTVALPSRPEQRLARLSRTIETEIVPRLVLARAIAPQLRLRGAALGYSAAGLGSWDPSPEAVSEFTEVVLVSDEAAAYSFVEMQRGRGASLETLYIDLLSPTARRLGDMWEEDRIDFTQVTVGLWRLHQVLREFSSAFQREIERRDQGRLVLLVPGPGEQHTFGLFMVAEFFQRAGWHVRIGPFSSTDELAATVRGDKYSVIGFSVSCESRLDALAADIRIVRRASQNRNIGVLVGGRVFTERPEYVAFVGADATAADGRQAPLTAQHLLSPMASRP